MRKIRTDLVGVVLAAGRNFAAGQDVPDDVTIDASLLDASASTPSDEKPAQDDEKPAQDDEKPAQDDEKPAQDDEKPAQDDEESEEDYSDLLEGDDAEKPAPKRSTGRRTSSRKG